MSDKNTNQNMAYFKHAKRRNGFATFRILTGTNHSFGPSENFVVFGSSLSVNSVIDLSDSLMFLMALFNIVGVYLLASKVKKELKIYLKVKSSE